jgi:hypothetical protein
MLGTSELTVGKGYVSELTQIACEVIELENRVVRYRTYYLATGEPFGGPRGSSRSRFLEWADREATHEEMGTLQRNSAEDLYPSPERTEDGPPNPSFEEAVYLTRVNSTLR